MFNIFKLMSSNKRRINLSGCALFLFSIAPAVVHSEESRLVINDCDNSPRLVEALGKGERVSVRVALDEAIADISKVDASLRSVGGGASAQPIKYTKFTKDGFDFDGVSAGEWKLCFTPSSVSAKEIAVLKSELAGSTGVSLEEGSAIAGVAASGALAIALGSSSGGSNGASSDPVALVAPSAPEVAANTNPTTVKAPTTVVSSDTVGQVRDSTTPAKVASCAAKKAGARRAAGDKCFIGDDEEVEPISPFS